LTFFQIGYIYEMDAALRDRIKNVTAARKSRDENKEFVLAHPDTIPDWLAFAFETDDRDSHLACWVLELVANERLELFAPHLDFICPRLHMLNDESAIRPLAKICLLLVVSNFKKTGKILLSNDNLKLITEACFDWLIGDAKVASKVHAMRTLYLIGNQIDWIHPELRMIVEKEYPHQSAAYKVGAREILGKTK